MAKILVVDDIGIVRYGTALVLKGHPGWEIDEADSGPEAINKVMSSSYSAILMDWNMPGMSGLECAIRIREIEKATGIHTPIICMTANSDRSIRENCLAAGMDDYLEKQCSNSELIMTVLKWISCQSQSLPTTTTLATAAERFTTAS